MMTACFLKTNTLTIEKKIKLSFLLQPAEDPPVEEGEVNLIEEENEQDIPTTKNVEDNLTVDNIQKNLTSFNLEDNLTSEEVQSSFDILNIQYLPSNQQLPQINMLLRLFYHSDQILSHFMFASLYIKLT